MMEKLEAVARAICRVDAYDRYGAPKDENGIPLLWEQAVELFWPLYKPLAGAAIAAMGWDPQNAVVIAQLQESIERAAGFVERLK